MSPTPAKQPQPLSAQQKANLAKASPEGVLKALRRLSGYASKERWLGTENRYRRDAVEQLGLDVKAPGGINRRHAADYIAASAPIHCTDGWSFLGRAMASHLQGDPGTALHLAYYAELRAAMALLATEGIGVFSGRHFVVEQDGKATFIGGGTPTHRAAWLILEDWAQKPAAAASLGAVLVPGNEPISEWVSNLAVGGSWAPIATDWFRRLGIDLQYFAMDRESRNEVSYRPSRIRPIASLPATDAALFAEELWSLLEPIGASAFGVIDRHLLRLTLAWTFESVTGSSPARAPQQFVRAVESTVAANVTDEQAVRWVDFLTRTVEPNDPSPLLLCKTRSKVTSSQHHIEVMSRAALLLRIASGAVRNALFEADLSLEKLKFWWPSFGVDRGLWTSAPAVSSLSDSWADVVDAFDLIDVWRATSAVLSYRDLLDACPAASVHLGRLDVVGLWSLAS
jgi:hypothetical protein